MKLFALALLAFGPALTTFAQEQIVSSNLPGTSAAGDFAQTSAAMPAMIQPVKGGLLFAPAANFAQSSYDLTRFTDLRSSFAGSDSLTSLGSTALAATPSSTSSAARPPRAGDEADAYRMALSLGITVLRFRSSAFLATGVGTNTSVAYFLSDHFAVEGAIATAFAPTIYANEHVKYVSYGAGPKFAFYQRGRRNLEPWIHAIIGGAHVFPQTGLGGKNGFDLQAGGGVDYSMSARISVRLEADWVRTQLWGQSQNSGQGVLAVVYHF